MNYKCNSKCNGTFVLIRFSDTLYFVVPKRFFPFRLYATPPPPDISPPFISPPKTPYEVIEALGFNMGFYGI